MKSMLAILAVSFPLLLFTGASSAVAQPPNRTPAEWAGLSKSTRIAYATNEETSGLAVVLRSGLSTAPAETPHRIVARAATPQVRAPRPLRVETPLRPTINIDANEGIVTASYNNRTLVLALEVPKKTLSPSEARVVAKAGAAALQGLDEWITPSAIVLDPKTGKVFLRIGDDTAELESTRLDKLNVTAVAPEGIVVSPPPCRSRGKRQPAIDRANRYPTCRATG